MHGTTNPKKNIVFLFRQFLLKSCPSVFAILWIRKAINIIICLFSLGKFSPFSPHSPNIQSELCCPNCLLFQSYRVHILLSNIYFSFPNVKLKTYLASFSLNSSAFLCRCLSSLHPSPPVPRPSTYSASFVEFFPLVCSLRSKFQISYLLLTPAS